MRRILVLVFVLLSIQGFAQPSNYSWYKQRTRQYSFMADSAMYLPRYNGTPSGVRSNESSTISGMVGIDTTNHRQYFRSGSSWRRLANYTELGVDSIWRVAGTDSIYYSKQGTTYKIKDSTGGGSTPTLQQVLTAGSTLTGNNNIVFDGFILNFKDNNSRSYLSLDGAADHKSLIIDVDDADSLYAGASFTAYPGSNSWVVEGSNDIGVFSREIITSGDITSGELNILSRFSNISEYESIIKVNADSILLKPHQGRLNIDSLRTWSAVADTTYKKPMTWDTRNGRWEYASNWFGGGGGGSYTASNGLTLSGSNFKLGGTLVDASTTVDANGNEFYITDASAAGVSSVVGGNTSALTLAGDVAANLYSTNGTRTASFLAEPTSGITISQTNGSDTVSLVVVKNHLIQLNPDRGRLYIDTLNTFSDTTNWKPMVYRESTGEVKRATYWPVGASGGTPAGNFGNLQINRNGAFATPGSDSLDWESSTGLTVTGGTRTTTLGVNKAAPTATYAAEIASDGTYTTNLKLSNTGTPTSFLTLNSVYGDVLSVGSLFKGSEFLISQSDGIFGISQGANQIARFTASDGMYAGRRWQTKQGADVASSVGAITLGGDGNVFEITGTSSITLIANTNWQNGATVTLLFTSTATLTDGTANSGSNIGMELAGNANFTATADDVLTLVLSEIGGTQRWREVSRSVN